MYRERRGLKYIVPANATQVEILLKKKTSIKQRNLHINVITTIVSRTL